MAPAVRPLLALTAVFALGFAAYMLLGVGVGVRHAEPRAATRYHCCALFAVLCCCVTVLCCCARLVCCALLLC